MVYFEGHYIEGIMSEMAPQITGVPIVCSTVCSGADQRKRQSSASLPIVRRTSAPPPPPPHTHTQRSSNAENVTMWLSYHENTQIHRLSLIIPAISHSLGISYTLSTFYFITDNLPQYTSFIYPETELVCTGTIYRFTCHWMAERSMCAEASVITVIYGPNTVSRELL